MSSTATSALQATVDALNTAGIHHMLAGSFASSLHGLARTTADIDIVIDPGTGNIERFTACLDRERFYVDDQAAQRAVRDHDQFNLVDTRTGWKIDLIVRKDRAFSTAEFDRRVAVTVIGVPVFVATPEDTVLAKLEWARMGGSERQVRDVVEILRIQGLSLDHAYIDRWAIELDLADVLAHARRQAAPDQQP